MKSATVEPFFIYTSKNAVRNGEPQQKEKSLGLKFKEVLTTFVHNTAFPGFSQISNSQSYFGKIFWLAFLVVGAYFTVEQSCELMKQYFKYGVISRTSREMESTPMFPAITICANSLINIDAGNLSKRLWQSALQEAQVINESEISSYEAQLLRRHIIYAIEQLSVEERIEIGYKLNDLVLEYTTENGFTGWYKPHIIISHSKEYGNCFTWNSYLLENGTYDIDKEMKVYLTSSWDIYKNAIPEYGPVVVIHERRTAPPLQAQYIINLFPQKYTTIKMQRTTVSRLKAPYASKCVESKDPEVKKKSFYYSESAPYDYSWGACLDACKQMEIIKTCNCYTRNLPLPPNIPIGSLDFCLHGYYCEEYRNKTVLLCDCPLTCEETTYQVDIVQNDRKFTFGDGLDYMEGVQLAAYYNNVSALTASARLPTSDTICGFSAFFSSAYYETVKEEEELTVSAIFGAIGGSLGLWIGISVMTFGEIVDLIIRVLYIQLEHLHQICISIIK